MTTTFGFTQLAQEVFGGVANQNPASNWTTCAGYSNLQVLTGRLISTAVTKCQAIWAPTGISWHDDQFLDFTSTVSKFGQAAGLKAGIRIDQAATQGYYLQVTGTIGISCSIQISDINGVAIGPAIHAIVNQGDSFRLAAFGNILLAYQNGAQIISTTDSQFLSGGSPAIYSLDANSHPFTVGVTKVDAGTAFETNRPPTQALYERYSGANLAQAFDNPSQLDLVHIIDSNGNLVYLIDFDGDDSVTAADLAQATTYALLGTFRGTSFANAFPNPQNLDIFQVVNPAGGAVVWYVDYLGNALFAST